MIEQELAIGDRVDDSELAQVRQRRADIDATIDNLLDNITPTNREYIDRRIEKLKSETKELEQREEALLEQQGQEVRQQSWPRPRCCWPGRSTGSPPTGR